MGYHYAYYIVMDIYLKKRIIVALVVVDVSFKFIEICYDFLIC